MAGVNLNDTVGIIMRVLNHHQEIIRLWHDVTALLVKLGLLPQQPSATVVTRSGHSFDTRWVQTALNQTMGSSLAVDGDIGPATTAVVKDFQKKHGLDPDGWVGVLTLAKLEEVTSP
jgi:peptidoglycan hydrolase-like protein with peptidoglycan-binding domain